MASTRVRKQSVLVVGFSETIRSDVEAYLNGSGYYQVVGEAATLGKAIELAGTTRSDIVLVDMEMEEDNGLSLTRDLRSLLPSTTLLVATHSEKDEYESAARAAGAIAYVTKKRLFQNLIPALTEAIDTGKRSRGNGDFVQAKQDARPSSHQLQGGQPFTTPDGVWWRPRTWGEWRAGLGALGWALVHGAPTDRDLPSSYWRYVDIALGFAISMTLIDLLVGGFDRTHIILKVLVIISLAGLAIAEFRQVRRVSKVKRMAADESRSPGSSNP